MSSDFDPKKEVDALRKALFALDWYSTELDAARAGDEDALVEARGYLFNYLNDDSCPLESRDHALNVVEVLLRNMTAARAKAEIASFYQNAERERLAEEKRRRKYVALWKAFVVLLLVVTTGVLWRSSATALGAVVPIILVVYVLLGDAVPLKLAASFLKKRDDD